MGTDELTRIHELAKRVTLLEKMVLRQQSRIDELVQSIERAADNKNRPLSMRADATQSAGDRAAEENTTAVRAVPSVSDLLDEEMKHELTHAYTASPVQQQEPPWDRAASAMERAAGSYARATGGKEPMQSDRAKQNEAARRKIAEETLEQIPVHELRERTPAERASDYMRDYNALYDVPGTMFQKKRAQDDFIKLYEVLGLRCTNMQLRLSHPELEPRGNNLFAVVPNPFLVYGEEMHMAGGMREAFNSNYRAGNTYGRFTVKETATFQFGTIGKVFKKGQLEAEI